MYLTNNKGKSVATDRFTRTLKDKIGKKTTRKCRSYLDYLRKLVDEFKKMFCSKITVLLVKNLTDYSTLTEEIEANPKAPNLKLVIESGILSTKILLAKVTSINGQEKYL